MSESNHQEDIRIQNQQTLTKLVRAITFSQGRFSLIVVRCNRCTLQQKTLEELRQGCGLQIREINLDKSASNLYSILEAEIGSQTPDGVMLFGLESVKLLDDLLISMNQVRDDFPKTFPFPLVLWINDFVLQKFVRLAPDFYSYAGAPIKFAIATDELIKFLQQQADGVFNTILEAGADQFISNAALNLAMGAGKRWEIESALEELENRGYHQPELEASEKFILGRDAYANNDMVRSRQLWEESLAFWQNNVGVGFPHPMGFPHPEGRREERQACILFHLGLWWRRYAVQHRNEYETACTQARDYYQQCVGILQQINRLDLVAKFISSLGETLFQLRQWNDLEKLANQAIELNQTYPNNRRLAYAYGFLAEVALERKDWGKAKEYGEIALKINETPPTDFKPKATGTKPTYAGSKRQVLLTTKLYKSWYLFVISQAQQHLNQIPSALQKLETAKQEAIPDYHPQLYIRILEALRNLYFQLGEYLQAFHIKQEKFAVEQQYGLRAFIGAGRLRSQREVIHPALVPFASVGLDSLEEEREFPTDNIAQEIVASGRKEDVDRLIERLSRPDNKLIVIHGPSGVGKSSLLTAGLVPALQQITLLEGRNSLPVVVRVYTDWLRKLRNKLFSTTRSLALPGNDLPGGSDSTNDTQGRAFDAMGSQPETGNQYEPETGNQYEDIHITRSLALPGNDLPGGSASTNDTQGRACDTMGSQPETGNQCEPETGNQCEPETGNQYEDIHITPSLALPGNDLPGGSASTNDTQGRAFDKMGSQPETGNQYEEEILQQLRYNADQNLLTILIFDQFEEFFFNCPQPGDRRKFWDFLHQCLDSIDIPYVKVILSLREDYLHYLLECDRLTNLQVTKNDILNKDIRYYFGNFSPDEAKKVIYSLTENSAALEPALIDELVRDLAGELGEVRPIELQVVGTQLETEKITTLAQYKKYGTKEKLVDRFLTAVVKDCGQENERVAQLVLYLLTDENNTRPLKTRSDLAADLAAEVDKLDLVLEILVTSGIVFLIPQSPADCYQLVHDYLVAFIRQQRGVELLAELERERQQRQEAETKLNRFLKKRLREAYIAGAGLMALAAVAVVFGLELYRSRINAGINQIRTLSEQNFASNLDRQGLIESLKAGDKLKHTPKFWVKPDTRTQIVATLHQAIYRLNDIELNTLKGHNSRVNSVSFSPDGKTIASASYDNTIKLWTADGKLIKTFKGHNSRVNSVSFSLDGKTIASASWDNTIKLWTVDGKLIKTLKGHSSSVSSVSFSPDGKTIASASGDKTIKLWTLDGKLIKTLKGHSSLISSVIFSPDGKTIASASGDRTIKLWTVDGKLIKTLKGHSSSISSVSFSPDGKTIASGSDDSTIKLWSFHGKLIKTLKEHSSSVSSVSFSPDGKNIASASGDRTIKLWSVDGKLIKTLKGHCTEPHKGSSLGSNRSGNYCSWVSSVSFSPDSKTIASASADSTVKLWSVDGKLIKTLKGHSREVISVRFSPDGKTIASASDDSTIKLWSFHGKGIKTLKGHSSRVNSVSFSPDGKTIASASADSTVKLWSVDGKLIKTLKGHGYSVYSISFSPNGKIIASASRDNTIKLWTVDGKLIKTLKGHSYMVNSVRLSPESKTIASAS